LEATRARVLAEAQRGGWHEVDRRWFNEAGFSEADLERPGLSGALDGLRGRRLRALVLSRVDDIDASLRDLARLMTTATRESWALVALDVHPPAPPGRVVVATFAPHDRRRNAERTRAAIAARRARGLPVGRRSLLPRDIVDRIVAERRAGASLYAIKDRLNADGIKGSGGGYWYASTVRHALLVAEREARSDPARADDHADHPRGP
jgi:DNA invertase Pin-like site-specific DNA recombinase